MLPPGPLRTLLLGKPALATMEEVQGDTALEKPHIGFWSTPTKFPSNSQPQLLVMCVSHLVDIQLS